MQTFNFMNPQAPKPVMDAFPGIVKGGAAKAPAPTAYQFRTSAKAAAPMVEKEPEPVRLDPKPKKAPKAAKKAESEEEEPFVSEAPMRRLKGSTKPRKLL